ncbi:MAG TPA: alpha/beta fold hydrolase [Casimicrobiaceae bacterium]|nr:alpha/beta fold hydrolase [Casimicrobiaceae bacterium]
MELADYEFTVPLDHERPSGEQLSIFARAVKNGERAGEPRPWLLFLQGGPGFPGPRPLSDSGWLKRALEDYHVLLLDSRGNGRSGVVLPPTLARRGDARAQADYLMHFRADSIVRDAETIRRQLIGENEPWSVLGQSFGGFCAVTYLSMQPQGLREVFITGGLPPLSGGPDEYYRHTYPEVQRKTRNFFARYPADRELCLRIFEHLRAREVAVPAGGRLTVRRFQQVGFMLGFDDGMEKLHYLLESAFCRGPDGDELSLPFLRAVEGSQPFETNPIFAVLHEMCYTQGTASRWSAERVRAEFPDVNWAPGRPPSFTGEMIYPWMFEDYAGLRPLRDVAELLASEARWPALYDAAQLARNAVPCVAVIYAEDMYVPRALSERTAAAIAGMKVWLTNEYEHNGLRASPAVFERLLALRRDRS